MSSRHLVLVGLNYMPHRGTGDKNFWSALVPALSPDLDRISVVSVRSEARRRDSVNLAGCEIETRYVDPALLRPSGTTRFGGHSITPRGGSYPRILGIIEKQLVVRRIVAEVSNILRDHPAQQVHLMDNFGPGNRLIARAARRLGAAASVTATAYERRGRRFYHHFLKVSYRVPHMRVVALSRGLERQLVDLGVQRSAVSRIPWGISIERHARTDDRRAARARLGMVPDRPIVLWAGFIQQVREPDFRLAFRLATEAREQGLNATFVFAFKPETFRSEYAALDRPGFGINVMPTRVEEFAEIRAAADILFSPIVSRDCIVAPPLTWIESMGAGLPVLTTDVPGAGELVENGRTGYLAGNDIELLAKLFALCDEHAAMDGACRAKVAADYNLEDIRRAYVRLWFGEVT